MNGIQVLPQRGRIRSKASIGKQAPSRISAQIDNAFTVAGHALRAHVRHEKRAPDDSKMLRARGENGSR